MKRQAIRTGRESGAARNAPVLTTSKSQTTNKKAPAVYLKAGAWKRAAIQRPVPVASASREENPERAARGRRR